MKPLDAELDPIQFPLGAPWRRRLSAWLKAADEDRGASAFLEANVELCAQTIRSSATGARMVVNIPADALLSVLREGRYRNAYELPFVMGEQREPSETRRTVDALLGFGDQARQRYFGAVAIGGTGIRFYGEYCMVLRPAAVPGSCHIFSRNSYDLVRAPLASVPDARSLVECLRGTWGKHLVDLLTLKLLPSYRECHRLLTAGRISEEILRDEDFVEVQRVGTFGPGELEEVREATEDAVRERRVADQLRQRVVPTAAELLWSARRRVVAEELRRLGVRSRLVESQARGGRWR